MAQPSIQSSFVAGELAPALFGHVDFAKFSIGASTMRNFYVNFKGGAYSRAGFRFVGYSKQIQNQRATGTITWVVNPSTPPPSPGDTITLNGLVWTFVSGTAVGNQTHISGTIGFTLANLVAQLNASSDPALTVATYSVLSTGVIKITYNTSGIVGNSYTLAASGSTPSGPTLTGGSASGPRLITFQFSLSQGLCLEFGNFYMRVISQGAFVTDISKAISNITQANPAVVTTSSSHGMSSGDWDYINDVVGMTQVNGQTYVITVLTPTTFSLQDVFGNNIDSTGFTAYSSGGVASRIFTLDTPYAADDLKYLKFTQSADVMSLTLRNQDTGTEYPPYDLSRLSDSDWTLTVLDTSASIDPPTNVAGSPTNTGDATVGLTGLTNFQYVVTAVARDTGEESVASDIINIPNSVDISLTAGAENLSWDGLNGARYYNIYKAPPAFRSTVPVGSFFGFAGSTFGSAFVDNNITADLTLVPPLHKDPFAPGALLAVDVLTTGSSIVDLEYTINTTTGHDASGYGVMVGGAMQAFIFTNGGHDYADTDTITFQDGSGAIATGDIHFAANPTNGTTITLGGTVWTFVTGSPTGNQTRIQGGTQATVHVLVNDLTLSSDPNVSKCLYTEGVVELDIAYKTTGLIGNAFTLAASVATPSGGTLTGGTGGTPPTGTLVVGPESGTYPSAVAYFQERRVYANTANQPDTYWMSQPGSFTNFDNRVPTIDTDAIEGTPWSVQVDGIQFMLPILGGLVVLTGQAAYQVTGNGGSPSAPQPVTPSSQQALPQAYNGCNPRVPPVKIDYDIYYLQAKGSVIRSLSYNFWINVFTGVDVTYLSSHMFSFYNIYDMAWCEEPFKVMWCVRSDGVLLSLTSLKNQDVMGWARHDTNGAFVSATAVTEPPIDALYVATQRFFPNGTSPFMIERMDDRFWNSIENCWCVDAGLNLTQGTPSAMLTVSSASGLGQPVAAANLIGGTGYSGATQVTVNDPTGTGCTIRPTIVGGVITGLTFTGGSDYSNPSLVAVDPTNAGTGFSATVVLDNSATFTTSGNVFNSGMVGWVIRCGGGVAQITAYTSATAVTAALTTPIADAIPNSGGVLSPFPAGAWTLTEQVTTVSGLRHLAGLEVTGLADGNVIAPRVVSASGTITLDNPASAVIVGLGYEAQLQSLYLETGRNVQGRRKQIGAVTVRVEGSGSVDVGTNQQDGSTTVPGVIAPEWTNLTSAAIDGIGLSQAPYGSAEIQGTNIIRPVALYTGDVRVPVSSGYQKSGQVAVQQSNPLPAQILAFIREAEIGDDPESTPRPKQARQRG